MLASQGVRILPRFARNSRNCIGLVRTALLLLAVLAGPHGYAQTVAGFECGPFREIGRITAPEILECSGLVVSRKNPGVLWVHNDSGDSPRLFAVREGGGLLGVYHLTPADAVDWEDVARGPCSDPDKECLYVGDIGDNMLHRSQVQIYRVEEPTVPHEGPLIRMNLKGTERFDCRYPDEPHDAETLLVDPTTGTPYLVTKEWKDTVTGVYRFPGRPVSGEVVTLEKVATLPAHSSLTGGDIVQDGSMIVLRDYFLAYGYPRPTKGPLFEAFNAPPWLVLLGNEEQGEALGIAPSGTEIYTASEGLEGPIHKARCRLP